MDEKNAKLVDSLEKLIQTLMTKCSTLSLPDDTYLRIESLRQRISSLKSPTSDDR